MTTEIYPLFATLSIILFFAGIAVIACGVWAFECEGFLVGFGFMAIGALICVCVPLYIPIKKTTEHLKITEFYTETTNDCFKVYEKGINAKDPVFIVDNKFDLKNVSTITHIEKVSKRSVYGYTFFPSYTKVLFNGEGVIKTKNDKGTEGVEK